MRSVLGIDAAWTITQPSGVALVVETAQRWQLKRVAGSYSGFLDPNGTELARQRHEFDAPALLAAAAKATSEPVTLVSVDMPLANEPLTGRRASDDAISRAYGARQAGTHTPSSIRPGPISDQLRLSFAELGYPLQTGGPVQGGLIETYPHPDLIELAGAEKRLPYKEGNIGRYWRELPMPERRKRLLAEWTKIVDLLDAEIAGVRDALPLPVLPAPRRELKAYEDMLDAIVCAWVGICVLEGRAEAHGDEQSAIWVPAHA